MSDSIYNRESSAFPYLAQAANVSKLDIVEAGLIVEEHDRVQRCFDLIDNKLKRKELAKKQRKLIDSLKGQNILFAKDYLNYFLDINMSIKSLMNGN